jgi:hypothetical protein
LRPPDDDDDEVFRELRGAKAWSCPDASPCCCCCPNGDGALA